MAVYVDNAKNRHKHLVMSHMMADTRDELLAMADKLNLPHTFIQNPHTHREHFDVSQSYRKKAIQFGAKKVTPKMIVRMMQAKRAREANQIN